MEHTWLLCTNLKKQFEILRIKLRYQRSFTLIHDKYRDIFAKMSQIKVQNYQDGALIRSSKTELIEHYTSVESQRMN